MRPVRFAPRLLLPALLLAALGAGCATWRGAQLYQQGTTELEAGRPEAAIQHLERAARLVPEASEVQNHLGLAYAAEGRLPEARRAFQRAVDLDCANHAAQYNLELAEAALAAGEGSGPAARSVGSPASRPGAVPAEASPH